MDIEKLVTDAVDEVTKDKTNRILLQPHDPVGNVDLINKCIASIAATVCVKILKDLNISNEKP